MQRRFLLLSLAATQAVLATISPWRGKKGWLVNGIFHLHGRHHAR